MDRVHYRRYTPSKLQRSLPPGAAERNAYREQNSQYQRPVAAEGADTDGFREKIIVQGIISGIILAVVLVLNMADNPWASDLRGNLGGAISYHITAEQLAFEVRRVLGDGSALGGQNVYIDNPDSVPMEGLMLPQETADVQLGAPAPGEHTPSGRIDEDVLREIIGRAEGDDLQTTAPEPILLPEL